MIYSRYGKRAVDLVLALSGLMLLAFPMLAIALCIILISKGPVFFEQERIGRGGKIFVFRKFRTMIDNHGNPSTITVRGDNRIFAFGRLLRRYKLDELPQLWNVLLGEMSFVGFRPDVRGYYDNLRGAERRILLTRPGITGPSTVKYLNEEILLAQQEAPTKFNDEVIFPDKIRMNLRYMEECSLKNDLHWIWKTLGSGIGRTPSPHERND